MIKPDDVQLKIENLKNQKLLNPHPEKIMDNKFLDNPFFDPNDLLQVKYEMLRKYENENITSDQAAHCYGFSRMSFHRIKTAFNQEGINGLLPEQKGPREGHKVTDEIVMFLKQTLLDQPELSLMDLKIKTEEKYGISVHKRSIERAIKKKSTGHPRKANK